MLAEIEDLEYKDSGLAISKSFSTNVSYATIEVVLEVRNTTQEAVGNRISDPIPPNISEADIRHNGNESTHQTGKSWENTGDYLVLTDVFEPQEQAIQVFGYVLEEDDVDQSILDTLTKKPIVKSYDPTELQQEDSVPVANGDELGSDESDIDFGSFVPEGADLDTPEPASSESGSDPEPEEEPASSETDSAALDISRDGSIAANLVAELEQGEVDPQVEQQLAEALLPHLDNRANTERIRQVEAELNDIEAFIPIAEEFIENRGSLEEIQSDIDQLQKRVSALEADQNSTEATLDELEELADRIQRLIDLDSVE